MSDHDQPDGVLVVDKPPGPTSHDVVAVARRALATSRVGHTGTLDPMATGVLVLVAGRATRLAQFMAHDVKDYDAQVTFGRCTTTYDAQGETTAETGLTPDREALTAALARFAAAPLQTPPAYSAKKVAGEVAYRAARRDAPLTLAPVPVTVHALTLVDYAEGTAMLRMRVSAGFYVRSLAHDLGLDLGTGAFLAGLRRTRAGAFEAAQATGFEVLATAPRGLGRAHLQPLDGLLPDLAAAVVSAEGAARVRHGAAVQAPIVRPGRGDMVRLLDDAGQLLGIARPVGVAGGGTGPVFLQPVVVLG